MIQNTLIINNTDVSDWLIKYQPTDVPRQEDGVNIGMSIDGSHIYDILATKYDGVRIFRPLAPADYAILCGFMANNPITMSYYSTALNVTRTNVTARIKISVGNTAMNTVDRTLISDVTMAFEEK